MDPAFTSFSDTIQFIAQAYIHILPKDFLRYVLIAGGVYGLVNLAFASVLAGRKIRPNSPDAAQMRREFFASMRTVLIFTAIGAGLIATGLETGILTIDQSVSTRGWGYFAINVDCVA